MSKNGVTLKTRLGVIQGHWKWRRSIDHTTFYWSAIVNIYKYIYCAIFELFDVEQYRDLEIGVKGHSISLKLVPFESLDAVSYPPSIVTVALSIAVCEIFSVKEWRNFENQVRSHSRSLKMAPFDRPCDILMVGYCKYRYMYRLWVIWRWIISWSWNLDYRSSRSLKLVPFGRLGAVSYSPFILTMAVSVACVRYLASKSGVTLKTWLRFVQGHWKWHHLIDRIRVPVRLP